MNRLLQLRIPILIGLTSVLLIMLLVMVGYLRFSTTRAQDLQIFGDAPPFALTDHLERPVSSDALRGKVVVANFIYTNCPDICPLLSARMQELQERLRQEHLLGSDVQLLSFTVDPDRDTPAVLRKYAERHHADPDNWRFLWGPKETLVPLVVNGFHLGAQALPPPTRTAHDAGAREDAGADYEVMHSGRFVLIDGQGRIRAYYDGRELDLDRVIGDIRQLL